MALPVSIKHANVKVGYQVVAFAKNVRCSVAKHSSLLIYAHLRSASLIRSGNDCRFDSYWSGAFWSHCLAIQASPAQVSTCRTSIAVPDALLLRRAARQEQTSGRSRSARNTVLCRCVRTSASWPRSCFAIL